MTGHIDDEITNMLNPAGDCAGPADTCLLMPCRLAIASHVHPWPSDPARWRDLSDCQICGLTMLHLFIHSSAWVVRRVEHVRFLDERTARRGVSIDYVAPPDAVTLRRPDGQHERVLPMAIMRRKSLVNFDLRDHGGRRPSFDSIDGGYPTVDLHVADVPYGSRSRAWVEVEAQVGGWFATAVFSSCLVSAILLLAYLAKPKLDVGSALLVSFAAGLAALLVHHDPHRLVTRLLSKVRLLTTFAAVLALFAAAALAFDGPQAHDWLLALSIASLASTILITSSWLSALVRSIGNDPKESPWEHHRPRKSKVKMQNTSQDALPWAEAHHEQLARELENASHPYDRAYQELGFHRPAIRVASSERGRELYPWDKDFADNVHHRLDKHLRAVVALHANSENGSSETKFAC